MTCFEIMKLVIDKTAIAVFGATELTEEQGKTVRGHLEAMSNALNSGGAPDYADPVRRFAYIYCYPAAHAWLFADACETSEEIRQLVKSKVNVGEPLRVCLFGGGPGTEIVGFARFLSRVLAEDESVKVELLLLDRNQTWRENAFTTLECVVQELGRQGVDVSFELRYERFDFCQTQDLLPIGGRDLYVFNYSVSEAARHPEALKKLISSVAAFMSEGACVIIADREEKSLVALARNLLESAGLKITAERSGIRNLALAEDCNEIKKAYYDRIGRSPRVQFGKAGMDQGAFWLVGTRQGRQ
jgi:hypothetical protein